MGGGGGRCPRDCRHPRAPAARMVPPRVRPAPLRHAAVLRRVLLQEPRGPKRQGPAQAELLPVSGRRRGVRAEGLGKGCGPWGWRTPKGPASSEARPAAAPQEPEEGVNGRGSNLRGW